jgi:drug/metabolite transporter (DMT)-like permease
VTSSTIPRGAAFAIGGTVLLWASAFVAIRAAVEDVPALPLAVVRYLIASVVLAGVMAATRTRVPRRRAWLRLGVVGFFGIAVYNVALNVGLESIGAGSASLLVNTAPIFTAVIGALVLRERVPRPVQAGIAVGFLGACLIVVGEGKGFTVEPAALVVLVAAIAQSLYFILQRPLLGEYNALQVVSVAVWIGAGLMLPFSLTAVGDVWAAPLSAKLLTLYLGVFPAAVAYVLWSIGLSRVPVATAAAFLYGVPPTAVLLAWAFLGEVPGALTLVGGAIALAGVIAVNTLKRKPEPLGEASPPHEQSSSLERPAPRRRADLEGRHRLRRVRSRE